ncbi:MAG: FAD-binding protein [Planctomycetes bacterium]|nr:FAD-binding protein [Planctomycetota bacterium]
MDTCIIDDRILEELRDRAGMENVFDKIEDRDCYLIGVAKERSHPDLVIRPHTTEHVAGVASIANKYSIPIYTIGVSTGLPGWTVPIKGGIVLDLKNMDNILDLNARDLTITVQPGVIIRDLQIKTAKQRLFFPPAPGSAGFSTIGENVAKCSGRVTGVKYGVTRDYVLALEVVLPDGSIITTGRKTLKSVAGYDLTKFFVGSEGTLGVYTAITLKLLPMPEKQETIISYFSDFHDALNVADSIQVENHISVCSMEFADMACIDTIKDIPEVPVPEEAGALLLIDIDGNEKSVINDISRISAICRKNRTLKCETSRTEKETNTLWQMMRSVLLFLTDTEKMQFKDDVCVPRSRVREVLEMVYKLGKAASIKVAASGHIGEGHIHLNMTCVNTEKEATVHDFVEVVQKEIISIGCTFTREHGTVDEKPEFIKLELTVREIGLMTDLKRMFDPRGIMNPGNIFTQALIK